MPILTYASEIWGFEDLKILERIHCDFIRKILHLKKKTPFYMIYAESGRYPIEITVKTRMIAYWNRLLSGPKSKLSYQIYQHILHLPNYKSKWLSYIQEILNSCGMNYAWMNQNGMNNVKLKSKLKQVLVDQNTQKWHASLQDSHKGRTYSLFKTTVSLEKYLTILNRAEYINLIRFRTGNHSFPVETGRWNDIDYSDRKCHLCNTNDIGDEMHYLLVCPNFLAERQKFVKKQYYERPNILKFRKLMTSESITELRLLSKFVKHLLRVIV